jgi:HEAT repeat protein
MDYSVTLARHFSRLVWLLLNEPAAIDEQKAALRAVMTVSREGAVTLATRNWRLVVNDAELPEALIGVQELTAQLIGHAVRELRIAKGASPADVLGAARILSSEPVPGDGGLAVASRLSALGATTVHALVHAAPAPSPSPEPAPPPSPPPADDASSAHGPPEQQPLPPASVSGPASVGGDDGFFHAFAAVRQPKGSASELLGQLAGARSPNVVTRVLDELVTLAENAQREGRGEVVAEVFHGVVRREADVGDGEVKRAFVMAVRRMSKPTLLRAVAQMLPRRREQHDQFMTVLARAGEDGADAVIEQLTSAPSIGDRRVFFDALVRLNAGVSALIHMLGDARWYVARNAADLLGEMQAPEAEVPLTEALHHDDDRVRRAASSALTKLGTPRALQALHVALRDNSPQVREQAVAGLATRKGQKTASTLVKALDEETDLEVQQTILAALGRLATPDAVQKLIKAAEPEGRLFRKKSVAYRVAAVHALGEARTPAAIAALTALVKDKEKEVQEAVLRVVMQAQQRPETA